MNEEEKLSRSYAPPGILDRDGREIPTPGSIVWYQTDERGGKSYYLPAIVSVTMANLNPQGVEEGGLEGLDSRLHVHLNVQSPGVSYVEQNVPYDADGAPRTWRWPD